jgi:hypothetical protein
MSHIPPRPHPALLHWPPLQDGRARRLEAIPEPYSTLRIVAGSVGFALLMVCVLAVFGLVLGA